MDLITTSRKAATATHRYKREAKETKENDDEREANAKEIRLRICYRYANGQ